MEQLIFTVCLLYGTRTGFSSGKIILSDGSSKIKGKSQKMQKKKILILVDFIQFLYSLIVSWLAPSNSLR